MAEDKFFWLDGYLHHNCIILPHTTETYGVLLYPLKIGSFKLPSIKIKNFTEDGSNERNNMDLVDYKAITVLP
jgi:hypothetical protein